MSIIPCISKLCNVQKLGKNMKLGMAQKKKTKKRSQVFLSGGISIITN